MQFPSLLCQKSLRATRCSGSRGISDNKGLPCWKWKIWESGGEKKRGEGWGSTMRKRGRRKGDGGDGGIMLRVVLFVVPLTGSWGGSWKAKPLTVNITPQFHQTQLHCVTFRPSHSFKPNQERFTFPFLFISSNFVDLVVLLTDFVLLSCVSRLHKVKPFLFFYLFWFDTPLGVCTGCFVFEKWPDSLWHSCAWVLSGSSSSVQIDVASIKNRRGAYFPRTWSESRSWDASEMSRGAPGGITSIVSNGCNQL